LYKRLLQRIRVLLIEDNAPDITLVRMMLDDGHFELKAVPRLSSALELLAVEKFDVVVLDLGLPDSDGMGSLEPILRAAEYIPVILLTGLEDEVLAAESVRGGAQDYLVKGQFDPKTLSRSIRYSIERKRILSENARLATDLKRSEAALKSADRRKDEFLATLAHELRNPLAPIRNSLLIMQSSRADEPVAEKSLEIMERQIDHMVRLVDDLLDVSRISLGKLELRREEIDLAVVLKHALEASQPIIDSFGHQMLIEVPDQKMPVNADPIRLAQVFSNLLINAAKYTKPGGHIGFTIAVVDKQVSVSVKDDGVGIDPEMLDQVFEMFAQIGPSLDKTQGGLGLGLSIAKELIFMHGGSIEASSKGPGLGSEFVVRLPLSTPRVEAHRSANTGSDLGSQTFPCRVLVVDDNVDSAESLSLLLDMMGNETVMAHDGQAAIETAKKFTPDIALLDIGLPGISGYEVAAILRKMPELEHTLLVALTGWGQEEDRRRSIDAGFDHHLTKPAAVADLKKLLSSWDKSKLKTSA
jgi:two-component system, chemotaxis family, CheB/CheR fusion protein